MQKIRMLADLFFNWLDFRKGDARVEKGLFAKSDQRF